MNPLLRLALLTVLPFALATAPLAQADSQETKPVTTGQEKKEEKTPEQEAIEKYEKAIKDLPKTEGQFTLYTRKKEVLMELKEDELNKLFFVQATLNTGFGPLQAGDPLNMDYVDVFRLEKIDDESVRLVKPNLQYRWEENDPLAKPSEMAFPDAILDTYKVEATHAKEKKLLVNVTNLFNGNVFELKTAIDLATSPGYQADPANTYPEKVKSFPENSVVRMHLHFKKPQTGSPDSLLAMLLGAADSQLADTRSLPIKVTYNLWYRKDSGYKARPADPRLGYFTTDYFDVGKFNETDRTRRLIQRWNLKKKNPGAALSEPVKPIVWYLDPTIPEAYKPAVRDGVLMWNKAFEKLGFKDVMQVKDAPNDPDWDHADGRYNTIRWTITKDSSYAVAWFRTDPISGEILNASVTVDANYIPMTINEFKEVVQGDTTRQSWFSDGPDYYQLRQQLSNRLKPLGWHTKACTHAQELAEHAAHGWDLIQATDQKIDLQTYIRETIADTMAHEIGHCLGLRHNFAASLQHSAQDLTNDELIAKTGVASSVMDYTPVNTSAILHGGRTYYNPTVGAYDLWAIEYGYSDIPGDTLDEQAKALNTIAARAGQPGLLYLTDEDADGVNPLSVRWDLGSDVLTYLKDQYQAADLVMDYALTKAVKNGDPYTRRTYLVNRSLRTRYRNAQFAVRLVGGQEFRRHLKGDAGERLTLLPVEPAKQREAMKMLMHECILESDINLPQDVLFGLSPDPDSGGASYNASLRSYIGSQQRLVLAQLLSSVKIDAILENAFKTLPPNQPYTLIEHYDLLNAAVLTEIGANQVVSPLRRDLQRYYLAQLLRQAEAESGTINDDARLLASASIKDLHRRATAQLKSASLKDRMTRLHLQDMVDQIDRHLDRDANNAPY